MLLLFFALTTLSLEAQRKVAITFDDLPATRGSYDEMKMITEKLLEVLSKYEVPAIGFVNESKLYVNSDEPHSDYVNLLNQWLDHGMELGNHTFSHIYINQATVEEYKEDVIRGEKVTRSLLREREDSLKYFRHTQLRTGPTDEYRYELSEFLDRRGYTVAPVTIDHDEYIFAYAYYQAVDKGDEKAAKQIEAAYLKYMEEVFSYYDKISRKFFGYEPSQILLLHANLINAVVMEELIKMMKRRGYDFISIEQALTDPAYNRGDITSARGLSWIHRWMLAEGKRPDPAPEVPDNILELYRHYQSD